MQPPYRPQDYGFDFAFGLEGGPVDPTIATITLYFVDFFYDTNGVKHKNKTALPIDLCSNTGFNFANKTVVDLYGVNQYYCIANNSDYFLMGDYYSTNFAFLEISLNRCFNSTNNPVVCQDIDTIFNFINQETLSFVYLNSYFDFNEYNENNVIKTFIDDSLFYELDTSVIKSSNIFI